MISQKKDALNHERESTLTFEQQRILAAKVSQDAEIARKKAEREANQREINSTLNELNSKKQAEWDVKKNDKTNLEKSLRLQEENKQLLSKL